MGGGGWVFVVFLTTGHLIENTMSNIEDTSELQFRVDDGCTYDYHKINQKNKVSIEWYGRPGNTWRSYCSYHFIGENPDNVATGWKVCFNYTVHRNYIINCNISLIFTSGFDSVDKGMLLDNIDLQSKMSEWCSKEEIGSVAVKWSMDQEKKCYNYDAMLQIQVWAVPETEMTIVALTFLVIGAMSAVFLLVLIIVSCVRKRLNQNSIPITSTATCTYIAAEQQSTIHTSAPYEDQGNMGQTTVQSQVDSSAAPPSYAECLKNSDDALPPPYGSL